MSDFVTVDEVGDVADLPLPPSPTVAMETSPEDPPALVQKDAQTVPHFRDETETCVMKLRLPVLNIMM